ncbi:hypothetical protein BLA39750_07882 [Burkholderia lata]|uniref:Uncharacterized protein n=1 Tax=Burkholderia lata (strain ATCC 17760 / DSM 23089 / LMG 22485 / NCIMB 9086 / R18194 / 383) TaxID=482957 RepID=A0A6P3BYG2_BURL3|nr:hypothetical protein BLA39750_07882 [Burkholderia lata]
MVAFGDECQKGEDDAGRAGRERGLGRCHRANQHRGRRRLPRECGKRDGEYAAGGNGPRPPVDRGGDRRPRVVVVLRLVLAAERIAQPVADQRGGRYFRRLAACAAGEQHTDRDDEHVAPCAGKRCAPAQVGRQEVDGAQRAERGDQQRGGPCDRRECVAAGRAAGNVVVAFRLLPHRGSLRTNYRVRRSPCGILRAAM